MKIGQIALFAIALSSGFTVCAQEITEKISTEHLRTEKVAVSRSLIQSPEQIATTRTEELKSTVQISEEQEAAVKSLFLKIENRKTGLTSMSPEQKTQALKELKAAEDRELGLILKTPEKDVMTKENSTTKSATNK